MRLQRALRPDEATCNVAASPDARIALMVAAASGAIQNYFVWAFWGDDTENGDPQNEAQFCRMMDSECLFLFLWKFQPALKGND